jgi:CheY-like chemotaxis protein/HPt (histidine-containing phosphotransfer) domain-containing protein
VLVAEDNAINQFVTVRLLEGLGCQVDTVETGQQAEEAVRQGHYDLVLMDLHMPDLDGLAATAAIRRYEQESGLERRTPIVALTADALAGDDEKCRAAGMDDYLAKPITSERLATVVRRWIANGRVGGSVADEANTGDSDNDREPLDRGALATLRYLQRSSPPGLLTRLITLYLNEVPSRLGELREAVAQGDSDRVKRVAHELRGSSVQLGATRMADLCAELQESASGNDLSQAETRVAELQREFATVRSALEAILTEAVTA